MNKVILYIVRSHILCYDDHIIQQLKNKNCKELPISNVGDNMTIHEPQSIIDTYEFDHCTGRLWRRAHTSF